MDGFSRSDILQLSELLKPQVEESEFEDEQRVKPYAKATPAELAKPKIVRKSEEIDKNEEHQNFDKDYFESEEADSSDWRKIPHWDLIYKQAVTPSDVYLQMSGKTQLTSSCEEMVITVDLPGEKAPNIDVKVTRNQLNLLASQFRLSVPLPHPVDPQKGNAKWDSNSDKLILTLIMDREFDFVNF